jgi:hypothetical protein
MGKTTGFRNLDNRREDLQFLTEQQQEFPLFLPALNFIVNVILIGYCRSQIFEVRPHFRRVFYLSLYYDSI